MTLRSGTVRARFTILYAAVFLGSGAALLVLTFLLANGSLTSPGPGEDAHTHQSRQLLLASLLALVVMAVVSVGLGGLLAKRVLRPLRVITGATRRITAADLDRRLAVTGPADEVKDLADTIDELLARLETSFVAQRRFVANAAHELRTPLATIRATLDVAEAKPGAEASTTALTGRLRVQLDRVDHLLEGFLVLARANHSVPVDVAPVDLADLVDAALLERAADVERKGLTVTIDAPVTMPTQGSPALLARLVANLVDNAVAHNEDRGWIRVGGSTADGELVLTVDTGGDVLDQDAVDRLTRPFERLGPERTGSSGLGLSIVAAVAEAHAGRVALRARPAGGLGVTVVLPV